VEHEKINLRISGGQMNLTQCKQAIKKAGLEPLPGRVYNIFKCGCITLNIGKPKLQIRLNGSNKKTRCCRKCRADGPMVTKIKICGGCGMLHIGDRLNDSKTCKKCHHQTYAPTDMRSSKFDNKKLADPSRWACVNRADCLMEYLKYKCIPCKGCRKYQLAKGTSDKINTVTPANKIKKLYRPEMVG
jgi:hypothetical protein